MGLTSAADIELAKLPSFASIYARAFLPRRRHNFSNGQTVPPMAALVHGVRIDSAHLRAYRACCYLPDGPHLPVTYLQMLAGRLSARLLVAKQFPVSPLGVVHLTNQIRLYRPVPTGEVLDFEARVEGHRRGPYGIEVEIPCSASITGERVWSGTMTALVKRHPRQEPRPSPPDPTVPASSPGIDWSLPENLGRRYAAVSGDYNPIHLHAATARLFGRPQSIAHGMWSMARALGQLKGVDPSAPMQFDVRFHKPMLLPSRVQFRSAMGTAANHNFEINSKDGARLHLQGECKSIEEQRK